MRRWTAREVRQLIAEASSATPRYELVDGELLVTPSPRREHQVALRLLIVALSQYLENERVGEPFLSPSDVELAPEDLRQPDIFVVPLDEDRRVANDGLPFQRLILAIEILSPSSARHDRVRKRPGYQKHVRDYLIFDLDARLVEHWRTGADRPEILTVRLEWLPDGASTPMFVDLPAFFTRVFGDSR
jgi:Uma2 family endonuclease